MSVGGLRRAAQTLGAPADCLDVLLQQGLIQAAREAPAVASAAASAAPAVAPTVALSDGERVLAARKFMNDNVVDAVGIRAFFFTLKLEKGFTAADMAALIPEFTKAITKGAAVKISRACWERARQMLG